MLTAGSGDHPSKSYHNIDVWCQPARSETCIGDCCPGEAICLLSLATVGEARVSSAP